jgi:hypothetical protein
MLPVVVKHRATPRVSRQPSAAGGSIEIERARAVLRLHGEVAPPLLRTLIEALDRG